MSYAWLACLSLFLSADAGPALQGTVVDDSGRPIVGALVDIATAAPRVGEGLFCPSCYPDCQKTTRTDANGKFIIRGLSPALKFRVLFAADGKKTLVTELIDPLDAPLTIPMNDLPTDVPPEQIVTGTVVDDNGLPVVAALVEVDGAQTADRRWWGQNKVSSVITDSHGKFSLLLPKEYLAVDIDVRATGFAGTAVPLQKPGAELPKIVLPTGTQVSGRLVKEGQPVAGVRIAVVQVDRRAGHFFIKAVGATSDASGSFKIENLPANEDYFIFSVVGDAPQSHVLTTKRFKARDNRAERDLGDLKLVPALQLSGQLKLNPGQRLPENARLAIGREDAWDLVSVPIHEDGRFEVPGLPPETYTIRLAAKGLAIDTTKLSYQGLRDNSFGLRLTQSKHDLEIPLLP